jgi:hypothetical protein
VQLPPDAKSEDVESCGPATSKVYTSDLKDFAPELTKNIVNDNFSRKHQERIMELETALAYMKG